VLADPRFAGKLPLFGGLDKAAFRRQVGPGDVLTLEVELGRMSARAGKGAAAPPSTATWRASANCSSSSSTL
jgi:3-hydroxymyristoyl/3-hydroxydecanoyl-(acyl carrier protein) dehydratase